MNAYQASYCQVIKPLSLMLLFPKLLLPFCIEALPNYLFVPVLVSSFSPYFLSHNTATLTTILTYHHVEGVMLRRSRQKRHSNRTGLSESQ